jgi:ribosomal protein S18 acetylase RimI-like enzyme
MKMEKSKASAEAALRARPAVSGDFEGISNLIFLEPHVHRHLDWRPPLEWLGQDPFWIIEDDARISAALACPPDPPPIAWIRLFAFVADMSGRAAWQLLWKEARQQLLEGGGATAVAIAVQRWLDTILTESGFNLADHIVLLENNDRLRLPARISSGLSIRTMTMEDLQSVADVDAAAFEPIWRNSFEALNHAYKQASYASVAEYQNTIAGYQLSTSSSFGTHLARLAVRPSAQRRGMGAALINDLIAHIPLGTEPRLTVNTQATNTASLSLYYGLGFRNTGERYPVYRIDVR